MIEWIAAALAGAVAGVFTGLIPGVHVNTVTALLLAVSAGLASLGVEYPELLAFTCSLAISHTFFDVVPGLFLGIPGDEAFAQLPGHRLVKRGEGEAAIRLSVAGSLIGLALGLPVMVVPLLAGAIGGLEALVRPAMFLVLVSVSGILVLTDRRKGWSLFVFLSSGLLGVAVFGSPLVAGGVDAPVNALFPSLAGLFGVAGLLFAIGTVAPGGGKAPSSTRASLGMSAPRIAADGGIGGGAGLLVGLLPGLGAANAATLLLLLQRLLGRLSRRTRGKSGAPGPPRDDPADARSYLVTTSSLNTSEALFAIAALYVIQRSRSGASIAVERILGGDVFPEDLRLMAVAMAIAGGVAATIMWFFGPRFASMFDSVDETGLNWSVIAFLVVLTSLLLGLGGLTILAVATAVGMVPLLFGVRRAQLMGFFLVPAMLFFSGRQERLVALLPIEQRTAPLLPSLTLAGIAAAVLAAVGAGALVYFAARARSGGRSSVRLSAAGGLGAAGVLALALSGLAYPGPGPLPPPEPEARADGRIERVIDGDTFRMVGLGRRFRVRLKGVDAPELSTDAGRAAAWEVAERFDGERVSWVPLSVDAYGRLVADVHLLDGRFLNAEIVRIGHARAVEDYPSEHRGLLLELEDEARSQGRGMWGAASGASGARPRSQPASTGSRSSALERWDDDGDGRIVCAEARRHGIAPVRRGHPAYPYMRDGNDDGVVCVGASGASGARPRSRPASTGSRSSALERWDDDGDGRIVCAEARRHGIAPVRRGHPAYPYMRDGNDDGVVCD